MREWRSITGFPAYEISCDGAVRTYRLRRHKILLTKPVSMIPQKDRNGYLTILLTSKNRKCHKKVHALVLTAFLGPKPTGYQCAHLNGNKTDNRIKNLKWVTAKENWSHKRIHGTASIGSKHGRSILTEENVVSILYSYRKRSSLKSLSSRFGVSVATIKDVVYGRTWKHV